jgi:hypothetical protein
MMFGCSVDGPNTKGVWFKGGSTANVIQGLYVEPDAGGYPIVFDAGADYNTMNGIILAAAAGATVNEIVDNGSTNSWEASAVDPVIVATHSRYHPGNKPFESILLKPTADKSEIFVLKAADGTNAVDISTSVTKRIDLVNSTNLIMYSNDFITQVLSIAGATGNLLTKGAITIYPAADGGEKLLIQTAAGTAVIDASTTGGIGTLALGNSANFKVYSDNFSTTKFTVDGATGNTLIKGTLTAGGATPPNITGSRGGNAALASLLTALATIGLIQDSTTP